MEKGQTMRKQTDFKPLNFDYELKFALISETELEARQLATMQVIDMFLELKRGIKRYNGCRTWSYRFIKVEEIISAIKPVAKINEHGVVVHNLKIFCFTYVFYKTLN